MRHSDIKTNSAVRNQYTFILFILFLGIIYPNRSMIGNDNQLQVTNYYLLCNIELRYPNVASLETIQSGFFRSIF